MSAVCGIRPGHVPINLRVGIDVFVVLDKIDKIINIVVIGIDLSAESADLLDGDDIPVLFFKRGLKIVIVGADYGAGSILLHLISADVVLGVVSVSCQRASAYVHICGNHFLDTESRGNIPHILHGVFREAVSDGKNLERIRIFVCSSHGNIIRYGKISAGKSDAYGVGARLVLVVSGAVNGKVLRCDNGFRAVAHYLKDAQSLACEIFAQ